MITVLQFIHRESGTTSLRLKRKKDYRLRFSYKNQEVITTLSSSLEPAWIVADFCTDFIGYIVDGITGDWSSFDEPIVVHFPADSNEKIYSKYPVVMADQEAPRTKIVLNARAGLAFPASNVTGFIYGFGLGYDAIPKFTFLALYESGSGVNMLPQASSYYMNGSYSHFNLECRYKMEGNFYIIGGGGLSHITSDSLELSRKSYNDSTGELFDNPLHTAPVAKRIPTLFAGIGISGPTSYFEIRHTFGISSIPLSNGETGRFGVTTLTFGLNLHF